MNPKPTTTGDILRHATARLQAVGIATARLDSLVLLEDVLNTNSTHILARPDESMTIEQQQHIIRLLKLRESHVPLAYIRHKTEFYGREFYIDKRVLEPRPESETMIDSLHELAPALPTNTAIIDVGTGSGALAITAKLEIPNICAYATDIDEQCLVIARRNARMLRTSVAFSHANLLNTLNINSPPQVIVLANLPYVPNDFHINRAATHEPKRAIFGGPDGLDVYRLLFNQLRTRHDLPTTHVITESLPPQHDTLAAIASAASYSLTGTNDFIQVFKTGFDNSGS